MNRDSPARGNIRDLAKWARTRKPGAWERVPQPPGPKPPERVDGGDVRVTLIGHATLLIQMDGVNVLTDPLWEPRTSPVTFAGPKRFRDPALRFEDLPPIDVVLLSHNHYDHLCVRTLRRLARAHAPVIYTGLGNDALLRQERIPGGVEMDWWDQKSFRDDVEIIAAPANHFSGRGPGDRDRTLWLSLMLKGPSGLVYFAGDTGYGAHFEEVRERFGAPRLSLIPIGAYKPRWFMSPVHMDPQQAVQAHLDLESQTSVGIHYGTFALADDGQDEPVEELAVARTELGVSPEAFRVLEHGVGHECAGAEALV